MKNKSFSLFLALILGASLYAQEIRQVTTQLPGAAAPQNITVKVKNGIAFWGEDIRLGPVDQLGEGRGGAGLRDRNTRWPDGIVPYELADDHPMARKIRRAIDTLNAKTNLQIRPKTSSDQYWIKFQNTAGEDACWSDLGRRPLAEQPQIIEINSHCDWDAMSDPHRYTYGSVMHEILHAVGLYHEQCREDRTSCITMNQASLTALEPAWRSQWDIVPMSQSNVSATYDLRSIMHYPRTTTNASGTELTMFTKLEPCGSVPDRDIGQRKRLSSGDIRIINYMYPRRAASGSGRTTGRDAGASGGAADTLSGRGGAADASSSFDVRYNVQLVPQPTSMSCWAASAAMVYGWLRNVRVNVDEIRNAVGVWRSFPVELRTGLQPNDVRIFKQLHFCCEAPMCYTVDGFRNLLQSYGPLWVAGAVPGPHVRVVYGMYGDGTPSGTRVLVHDPWGSNLPTNREPTAAELAANRGQSYERTYTQFMNEMEGLGAQETSIPGAVYVIHAPGTTGTCSCQN
jgi:hypothetical protein